MNGSGIKKGDILILVGTRKGGFILSSDKSRKDWNLSGPFNDYGDVFHMVYDFRNGGTILSAVNSNIWGTGQPRSGQYVVGRGEKSEDERRLGPLRQSTLAYRAGAGERAGCSVYGRRARVAVQEP